MSCSECGLPDGWLCGKCSAKLAKYNLAVHDAKVAEPRSFKSRKWKLALGGWVLTAVLAGVFLGLGIADRQWEELVFGLVMWASGAVWFWLFLGADLRHFKIR